MNSALSLLSSLLMATKFEQVFTMERKYDPTFANCQPNDNWTKLTFQPNFKKFKMEHLEDDVVGLMKKLVLDMAERLGKTVKVELNGRFVRIIDSFEDYNHLCMKSAEMSRPVNAIELALSEEKAEYRNTWNHHFKSCEELIVFSKADLERSIPSVVDGLIPDQRKVLFCAFERKLYEEINVDQFIGYVSSPHSACHNCEKSLACTIIEMGQDFVGSNNISLLKPNHQFGTRDLGGKDHARARCIYTELNPLTRCLFHEDDDKLLRLNESTELNWYIPIIPLVLVNGSRGIGAGWTYIPSYDPKVIIANVKKFLRGDDLDQMDPFYNRFKGTIEKTTNKGEYRVWGCIKSVGNQTYEITELPVGMWTGDYLEFLSTMCGGSPNANDPLIEDIDINTEDYANVNIKIKIKSDQIASISNLNKNELYEKFKLISTVSTNNMYLFDADGKIKKFDNPEQILKEFCAPLPAYYEKRKEILRSKFTQRIQILESKAKYIEMVVQGGISVLLKMMNQPEHELISELTSKGIFPEQAQEDANNKEEGTWGGYEYLRSLPSRFFSQEYVDKLVEDKRKISLELAALEKRSLSEMWMMDLVELEEKIVEINRKEEAEEKRKRSSQAEEDTETEVADMGEEAAEYLSPNTTDYKSSESSSESESESSSESESDLDDSS